MENLNNGELKMVEQAGIICPCCNRQMQFFTDEVKQKMLLCTSCYFNVGRTRNDLSEEDMILEVEELRARIELSHTTKK